MLNKKLLAVALSMAVSGVAFGDNAGDSHITSLVVPEAQLIDVGVDDLATALPLIEFLCEVNGGAYAVGATKDQAGQGLVCDVTDNTIPYSITSSESLTPGTARLITAQLDANVHSTWLLEAKVVKVAGSTLADAAIIEGTAVAGNVALTTTPASLVTAIGAVASGGDTGTFEYVLSQKTVGVPMAYGTLTPTVTYALTDD